MKVGFTAEIQKFISQGEKTGWSYIVIPAKVIAKIDPGNKRSFRVKGKLDSVDISRVALLPMGDGTFIMAINATMRKALGKQKGGVIKVVVEKDDASAVLSHLLLSCLNEDREAKIFFDSLAASHRQYFSNWIESAKTEATKIKRVAAALNALSNNMGFSEMSRMLKKNRITR